jgi:hypothetical protein
MGWVTRVDTASIFIQSILPSDIGYNGNTLSFSGIRSKRRPGDEKYARGYDGIEIHTGPTVSTPPKHLIEDSGCYLNWFQPPSRDLSPTLPHKWETRAVTTLVQKIRDSDLALLHYAAHHIISHLIASISSRNVEPHSNNNRPAHRIMRYV